MKILWFTWKDLKNPLAGGAEVVNEEIAKRLVADGHEVKLIVGGFKGCKEQEFISGYEVIRVGGRLSVYWQAYRHYKKKLFEWPDLIIEEVNTIPFFTCFYAKQRKLLVIHQLCREVWFYQMIFPFSYIGYLLEPLYLKFLRNMKVLTISNSSRADLIKHGFKSENISVFILGVETSSIKQINWQEKFAFPTILSLGAIREMKRVDDQIKAFEIAKADIADLKILIAGTGDGKYFQKVMRLIERSPYSKDIEYLGRVDKEKKIKLMRRSHLIVVTSVKEGWGLIVTEAATQGTPAGVYDVDGLRDSVKDNLTGFVSGKKPEDLTSSIVRFFSNQKKLQDLSEKALVNSRLHTFDNMYNDFKQKAGIK